MAKMKNKFQTEEVDVRKLVQDYWDHLAEERTTSETEELETFESRRK